MALIRRPRTAAHGQRLHRAFFNRIDMIEAEIGQRAKQSAVRRPQSICSVSEFTKQVEDASWLRPIQRTMQAGSWTKSRRVVAKVEWHPGELYPRVGFIVTNMSRPAERVVAFYSKRGTCEQWIKEGKGAIKWTRLSCRSFAANAVRLQLHALAYNLGNFLRTLATPEPIKILWGGG
jgi:hypothetical protein